MTQVKGSLTLSTKNGGSSVEKTHGAGVRQVKGSSNFSRGDT